MATGFEVDVHALRTLARDLGDALHSMASARSELPGWPGTPGGPPLPSRARTDGGAA